MAAEHHHPAELAPVEARIAAIESVLIEKGILDTAAVDAVVAHVERNLGPMNGDGSSRERGAIPPTGSSFSTTRPQLPGTV
jgi:hypothetical protein